MWYPGHVEKAKKQIAKHLKAVDAIVELLDARIPFTSRAYEYERLFQNKPVIFVLNKEDLADASITKRWLKHFQQKGQPVLATNLKNVNVKDFLVKRVMPFVKSKFTEKRIMIVGIPNVGKSTFINRLRGKKSLAVGNKPGVTRGVQWITAAKGLIVLDTPGILYTRLHSPSIVTKLLAVGAMPFEKMDTIEAAKSVFNLLFERYSNAPLEKRLGNPFVDFMDFLNKFSIKRGFLKAHGEVDLERGAFVFLREIADGKFGRFSYEIPEEVMTIMSKKTIKDSKEV
ncbi:MAG: ribosome biogenesis GTPase YlqF [Thermotogae bacterium]|uniref:ribosome biogenesis GTPase YlqF n=1 Tax=Kosmotoga sp. TaxID=1955248 RepID=UPI000F1C92E6|nr:ribosome biogenesis GTPase YlqF [Kosmotoga sp.]MBO8167097.1 ribosome biogenesis GTPase YlqF [Kosmotoga sp.]MCD6160627.1 ribosome biogenesis GTPase YlqF [Kosmotoga sp.]RKX49610.1 MAG: ribosome biogenesis GTPase YlqF [Thermotogota bacterium]